VVTITYLWNLQSLATKGFPRFNQTVSIAIATLLATAAVTFKLAFTNEDSPELMAGLAKTMAGEEMDVSLVSRAQIVFIALGLALAYTLATSFSHKKPNRAFNSHLPFPFLVCINKSKQQCAQSTTS
jgi:ethanolaminephosphotransferase